MLEETNLSNPEVSDTAQEKAFNESSNQDKSTQTEASQKPAQKTVSEEDPSIVEENISVARSAPDVVVENLHSTTVPEATDIPSANAPDQAANAALKKERAKSDGLAVEGKAKKEKAPGVENKPFAEFVQQDYLPALKQGLQKQGIQDIDLVFEKQKIPIYGYQSDTCWQVIGHWSNGQHEFRVYFPSEDIQGQRAFSCADYKTHPSTLEPFLIDERTVTLDLLVFGVVRRLNAQKWLGRN